MLLMLTDIAIDTVTVFLLHHCRLCCNCIDSKFVYFSTMAQFVIILITRVSVWVGCLWLQVLSTSRKTNMESKKACESIFAWVDVCLCVSCCILQLVLSQSSVFTYYTTKLCYISVWLSATHCRVSTWMGTICLCVGKPSRYVTGHPSQFSFLSSGVDKSSTSLWLALRPVCSLQSLVSGKR